MGRPKLIMIDEPSLGLAPIVVERVVDVAREINREGTAVLLVEQDVMIALEAADYAYVLENGHVALEGNAKDLQQDPAVRKAYLGV
jgi:branched-chain amino acid transport system ATP-binding protein